MTACRRPLAATFALLTAAALTATAPAAAEAARGAATDTASTATAAAPAPASPPAGATAAEPGPKEAPAAEPDVAELELRTKRLDAEYQLRLKERELGLAALELERRTLTARAAVEEARGAAERAAAASELARLTLERSRAEQESAVARLRREGELAEARHALEVAEARRLADATVTGSVQYRAEPFVNGVLHVSDRRIPLNGVFDEALADSVTDAIAFYNNRSRELPIFLVIDSSPGGSVMSGTRIVRAMQSSEAPVHVLVKSYAASMAAVLVTTADHSYAYPNAILLHHQLWSITSGNIRQTERDLETMQEWYRRLVEPVCAKLGMTREEFVAAMYAHDPDGDWSEFADEAAKLRWVGHVVKDVREEGVSALGDAREKVGTRVSLTRPIAAAVSIDDLPPLGPFDAWFVHAPRSPGGREGASGGNP
jgi:ATP-dependent Clp protease protease subunit